MKTRRSFFTVFCTPALRRLSRIICSNWTAESRWPSLLRRRPLFVGREDAVRREALDGERPGDADALVVLVRLVVEQLGVGVARDRRVDLLARHAFFDVRVVRDRLQRDVRHALVDEALPDVVVGLVLRRDLAGDLGFLS